MTGRDRVPPDADAATLRAEIERLTKVVDALMDQSEAEMNLHGTDFGLFRTTVLLQDQVRLHTEALAGRGGGGGQATPSAGDMQDLRRTAALQIQLLELVVQQKDVGELVERVSSILDVPIVLFDAEGDVVSASRSAAEVPGLGGRLWDAYSASQGGPDRAAPATAQGEPAVFRDIVVMGHVERVLAAVARRSTEFAGASLLFLQQLVTLDLLRGRDERRMRRRLRRGLLRDVLAGESAPDELRVRLQAQGFDEQDVLRVCVVEPREALPAADAGPSSASRAGDLLHAIDTVLSERRLPYLTSPEGSQAVVLTGLTDDATAAARALLAELTGATAAAAPDGVVAGCSAAFGSAAGAPRALQQARAACMAARHEPQEEARGVFEELSGHYRLLDGLDEAALRSLVGRTFGPLLDYDQRHHASLYATLAALFDHGLAVRETADALHIHRNTLQKRLAHIERLLGIDLADLDAIVDIRLGLHAAELLGEPAR